MGPSIGQQLSHYEVIEKLGEGGMGVVYKARDSRLERFVAIKLLTSERALDPCSRRRFLREAQAASILNNPHIVAIYDIAFEGDADLIAMEFVDGRSLKSMIPPGGLPVKEAIGYAERIANAPFPSNIFFGGPARKTAYITMGGTGRLLKRQMSIPGAPPAFNA
jgi:eukaryotic-like serine/threonine-protein kinase